MHKNRGLKTRQLDDGIGDTLVLALEVPKIAGVTFNWVAATVMAAAPKKRRRRRSLLYAWIVPHHKSIFLSPVASP
jgi:hypothetical protein